MDTENIRLVQSSFEQMAPALEQATTLFFRRLGELDPALQFEAEAGSSTHGRVLTSMFCELVKDLPRPNQRLAAIRQTRLGEVSKVEIEEHYLTVGAALLWTLEQMLREHFSGDMCLAWLEAYTTVVALLQAEVEQIPESRLLVITVH